MNICGLQIKVVGIANSKKMLFNDEGIDLLNWKEELQAARRPMDIDEFVRIIAFKKRAQCGVCRCYCQRSYCLFSYDKLLQQSVSVVACNKIACSSPYDLL